jgi:hypothetical protein
MKKKALAALCLAGLTVTQICVAGGNNNWSGSDKYQPPKEDKTVTDTTAATSATHADRRSDRRDHRAQNRLRRQTWQ